MMSESLWLWRSYFASKGLSFLLCQRYITLPKLSGGPNEIIYVQYQVHGGDSVNDASDHDTFGGN